MARKKNVKGPKLERDRKIQKLTRMIESKERELTLVERRLEHAKDRVSKGELSKGDFQRLNIEIGRERKAVRGAITKLERSRLNRERALKERHLAKEERERKREDRRQERTEERERRREERKATGKDEEGD